MVPKPLIPSIHREQADMPDSASSCNAAARGLSTLESKSKTATRDEVFRRLRGKADPLATAAGPVVL